MKARAALALAIALTAGAARADESPTRQECIQASEDAQLYRIKTQLVAARVKLVTCSSEACPKVVRQDCSAWLDEVDRALPTVVLAARDGGGKDLVEVRVQLDGAPLVDRLDGKAVAVDPGDHVLRFESHGEAHEEKVVVREGEKNRIVSVTIGKPPPPPPVVVVQPIAPIAPPPRETRASSPATWVFGGLGLATLVAAGAVGAASLAQRQSLYDSCGSAGTCAQSDVDQVYLMYDLAYGGAAVGGALLLTGVILFFATRHSVVVTPTLGGASVMGRF